MNQLSLILRDRREELWRRWVDGLSEAVGADYFELVASPLGERMLRALTDGLITVTEAEEYERPGLLESIEARVTEDARHRLTFGFTIRDAIIGLHVLRGAVSDVLADALVVGEMPAFADTLDQLKAVNAYLDRLVCATLAAA